MTTAPRPRAVAAVARRQVERRARSISPSSGARDEQLDQRHYVVVGTDGKRLPALDEQGELRVTLPQPLKNEWGQYGGSRVTGTCPRLTAD